MILVLFGPPGAGKGTQGARIVQQYGIPKISTGEIFRDLAAAHSELGLKAKEYWSQGKLVPDEIVVGLVRERVSDADCRRGFILDGFPRTVSQADTLQTMLEEIGKRLNGVLNLRVAEPELIRRLSGRRTCSNCGATYHTTAMPSRVDDICDHCGNRLIQRADDTPESIHRRLMEYEEKTAPLIHYYEERGVLYHIDANEGPDAVYVKVQAVLRKIAC